MIELESLLNSCCRKTTKTKPRCLTEAETNMQRLTFWESCLISWEKTASRRPSFQLFLVKIVGNVQTNSSISRREKRFHLCFRMAVLFAGEKVLSGESKLSLTTNCLFMLSENFADISEEDFTTSFEVLPANTPKLPQHHDLQFLYDFVQKTIALKVVWLTLLFLKLS